MSIVSSVLRSPNVFAVWSFLHRRRDSPEYQIHIIRVVYSVTNNPGLCGIGIRPCSTMPLSVKLAVTLSLTAGLICLVGGGIFCWKRKIAITRPHRHHRDVPYAKARTTFVRDVQLARNVLQNHFSRPAPAYHQVMPFNPY